MTDVETLVRSYKEGKSISEIARRYHIKMGTIYVRLRKANCKMRNFKFKKGSNSWNFLNESEKKERIKRLKKRMTKYNPLKNPNVQLKLSQAMKRRKGESGLLTHGDRKRIIKSGGECSLCHIKYPLTVHHKSSNRYNNRPSNLQVLCFNCHYIVEHGNAKYSANRVVK